MFAPLVDKQPRAEFNDGSQDMSEFLTQRDNAESGKPQTLPWLAVGRGVDASAAPCIPDTDLELEWIHGYSAQVTMSQVLQLYYVIGIVAQHELAVLLRIQGRGQVSHFFPSPNFKDFFSLVDVISISLSLREFDAEPTIR